MDSAEVPLKAQLGSGFSGVKAGWAHVPFQVLFWCCLTGCYCLPTHIFLALLEVYSDGRLTTGTVRHYETWALAQLTPSTVLMWLRSGCYPRGPWLLQFLFTFWTLKQNQLCSKTKACTTFQHFSTASRHHCRCCNALFVCSWDGDITTPSLSLMVLAVASQNTKTFKLHTPDTAVKLPKCEVAISACVGQLPTMRHRDVPCHSVIGRQLRFMWEPSYNACLCCARVSHLLCLLMQWKEFLLKATELAGYNRLSIQLIGDFTWLLVSVECLILILFNHNIFFCWFVWK